MPCPLCSSENILCQLSLKSIPVFQNKVYTSYDYAKNVTCGDLSIYSCGNCGFVWNETFDPTLLEYDANYQNEQGLSKIFQEHLFQVLDIIQRKVPAGSHIIEIGCGKATFLSMLEDSGYCVHGYDPAYEGDNPHVIKEYYSINTTATNNIEFADMIILRHVLEHIQNPLDFLKNIAVANSYHGMIYIEVPDFDWICEHDAFYDIFYEHCNYFSLSTLRCLFPNNVASGIFFGGQYCYMIVQCSEFLHEIVPSIKEVSHPSINITKSLNKWKDLIKSHRNLVIWGAGAKGATFLRYVDPDKRYITGVIDINPKKQVKYIAKSGHKIYSPKSLPDLNPSGIIVMNGNYFEEVEAIVENQCLDGKIPLYVLDDVSDMNK